MMIPHIYLECLSIVSVHQSVVSTADKQELSTAQRTNAFVLRVPEGSDAFIKAYAKRKGANKDASDLFRAFAY